MHLEPESEQRGMENVDFHTGNMSRSQQQFFFIFWDEFLKREPLLIYRSPTSGMVDFSVHPPTA